MKSLILAFSLVMLGGLQVSAFAADKPCECHKTGTKCTCKDCTKETPCKCEKCGCHKKEEKK